MVQEVERGAAGARPLFQVPDAERAEQAFEHVALEPVVQQLRDGHREDARQVDDRLFAAAADVEAQTGDARQLAGVGRLDVRRRHEIESLQHTSECPHAIAELRPFRGIGRADVPNRLDRSSDVARQLECAAPPPAAGERHRDPRIRLFDPQAGAGQAEIADHDIGYPADIGRWIGRMALLDDEDVLARPGEVVRGDEAIRPGADDERVVAHLPSFRMRIAARRPEAPMMPPPGCVPEPH